MAKKRKKFSISTSQQWKAINSPTRIQILSIFESNGKMSVSELALQLGVPPDGLYHHVRTMRDAGILVELEYRKTSRIPEAVYDLAAQELEYDVDLRSGRNVDELDRLNKSVLRNAGKVLKSALVNGLGKMSGKHRNLYARYETARLDNDELEQVRQHIEAISNIFRNARKKNEGLLMMANCNLAPLSRGTKD